MSRFAHGLHLVGTVVSIPRGQIWLNKTVYVGRTAVYFKAKNLNLIKTLSYLMDLVSMVRSVGSAVKSNPSKKYRNYPHSYT